MSKVKMRWIVMVAALAILMTPATALPAQSSAPCADVAVSVDPTVAALGDTVTLAASITNCSTRRQYYIIKYKLSTPCTDMILLPIILRFDAGQTRAANVSFKIPTFICTGDYTLTVSVIALNGALLDTDSATLTVTPAAP
jgi:hypothetical protein